MFLILSYAYEMYETEIIQVVGQKRISISLRKKALLLLLQVEGPFGHVICSILWMHVNYVTLDVSVHQPIIGGAAFDPPPQPVQ